MRFQTAFVDASELGKPLVSFLPNIWSPLSSSKVDEDLVKNSGKFLLLDRMLPELKKRGHKVKLRLLEGWDTVISLWTKNVIKECFWFCRFCCSHKWQWCLTFWWITVTWETTNSVDWMALCPTQSEKKMWVDEHALWAHQQILLLWHWDMILHSTCL